MTPAEIRETLERVRSRCAGLATAIRSYRLHRTPVVFLEIQKQLDEAAKWCREALEASPPSISPEVPRPSPVPEPPVTQASPETRAAIAAMTRKWPVKPAAPSGGEARDAWRPAPACPDCGHPAPHIKHPCDWLETQNDGDRRECGCTLGFVASPEPSTPAAPPLTPLTCPVCDKPWNPGVYDCHHCGKSKPSTPAAPPLGGLREVVRKARLGTACNDECDLIAFTESQAIKMLESRDAEWSARLAEVTGLLQNAREAHDFVSARLDRTTAEAGARIDALLAQLAFRTTGMVDVDVLAVECPVCTALAGTACFDWALNPQRPGATRITNPGRVCLARVRRALEAHREAQRRGP